MMLLNRADIYLAKRFIINFGLTILGFSVLIFFINMLESLDRSGSAGVPFYMMIFMSFLHIADFLNDIAPSLVLISAIITFFGLSSRSELTVIRSCGYSLWQIIFPVALSSFLSGLLWIAVFNPISVSMNKNLNELERKYIDKEVREVFAPKNGIWLRQEDQDVKGGEIIIQAQKIYQGSFELGDVKLWFFDQNGGLTKRLNANTVNLKLGQLVLKDIIVNDANLINSYLEELVIQSNLEPEFVVQKIVNSFQDVRFFSIYELPALIASFGSSGFSSTKFEVYFQNLLCLPLLFMAMILVSCYFGLNHTRNKNNILKILLGIIVGVTLYISSTILSALGSSGIISIFSSTWLITILCLATGTLLIYKKEL